MPDAGQTRFRALRPVLTQQLGDKEGRGRRIGPVRRYDPQMGRCRPACRARAVAFVFLALLFGPPIAVQLAALPFGLGRG
jgi:hypothetical protein